MFVGKASRVKSLSDDTLYDRLLDLPTNTRLVRKGWKKRGQGAYPRMEHLKGAHSGRLWPYPQTLA